MTIDFFEKTDQKIGSIDDISRYNRRLCGDLEDMGAVILFILYGQIE